MSVEVIYDQMDDSGDTYVVRARLTLLDGKSSGRETGIRSGYRPNHNFGAEDNREMYIGQIEFPNEPDIELGETREVVVRFISGPGLPEKLTVGRQWRIQEGTKLVGKAIVLSVENET